MSCKVGRLMHLHSIHIKSAADVAEAFLQDIGWSRPYTARTADGSVQAREFSLGNSRTSGSPSMTLSGTGDLPTLAANPSGNLPFGNAPVGQVTPSQSVQITNTGTGPMFVTGATVSGTNAADFTVINACPQQTAIGSGSGQDSGCIISVSFTPQATGSRSATLSITSSASNSPTTIQLSGSATQANWTWIGGSMFTNLPPVYGTQGVPSATTTPGWRANPASWVDASGNVWLFGGAGTSTNGVFGDFSDLWKYDPATSQWTWIGGPNTITSAGSYGTVGVASNTNWPPCRDSSTAWTDSNGDFWLFGGWCNASARGNSTLNDLWMYNPTTGQWVWRSGSMTAIVAGTVVAGGAANYGTQGVAAPSNVPGARSGAVSWTDVSGNLWMFGGNANLNDLWTYNLTSNQWTWVNGSNTTEATGVYGTKGTAAATNVPGARTASATWKDDAGNFWLFGGVADVSTQYNDLWEFSPSAGQWTWVNGSNGTSATKAPVFGTPNNTPGAGTIAWTDATAGNFWLYGDYGDLWQYSVSANQWTWVSGPSTRPANSEPVYGTQGQASPSSTPGVRNGSVPWRDLAGHLWLYGGGDGRNDVWQISP
jgi:N-acetylneuraminic acid mutarotase